MKYLHCLLFATVVIAGPNGQTDRAAAQQPGAAGDSAIPGAPKEGPKAPPRTVAPAAASSAQLPNGASAINEVYGDWTVDCRIADGRKLCILSQAQGNSQTGQRTFAIELRAPVDGTANGTILMPFGLKLDSGARLKLDDKNLGPSLRYSTCLPQGCFLPVSFTAPMTDAFKKATELDVASLNHSNGETVTFKISLLGFGPALGRVVALDR